MKKEMIRLAAVTLVSVVAAQVFHRFLPGFGPAFKPLLWPFLYLGWTALKHARRVRP